MTEASRRTPWYLVLLRPAVGLPLALVLLGLSAPFAYRNFQLQRVPEIGEPFDIERYRYIELAPEENACELYSRAVALVTPMDETTGTSSSASGHR